MMRSRRARGLRAERKNSCVGGFGTACASTSIMSNKPYIVVVGADFSDASELAVQQAFELTSQQPDSEVHLVNVVQTYGPQVAYEMPLDASALSVLTITEARTRFRRYVDDAYERYLKANPSR